MPTFSYNLLSISKLTADSNCIVEFNSSTCIFQNQTSRQRIGSAREPSVLYYFERDLSFGGAGHAAASCFSVSRRQRIMLLHCSLGHPSFLYLRRLFPSLFRNNDSFYCEICQLAKQKRVPFPPQPYCASKPFALIHSDLRGPSRISTFVNKRWFLSFIDDHTRVCWIYLLKEKSEVESTFANFHSLIQTQYDSRFKFYVLIMALNFSTLFLINFSLKMV